MALRSLQINHIAWNLRSFGERAVILEPVAADPELSEIHTICHIIEGAGYEGLTDVIPTYKSIGLIFNEPVLDLDEISDQLERIIVKSERPETKQRSVHVPVCYELGLDWEELEFHTGLEKDEIIRMYTEQNYTVAMMGFIPGFLYLQGLNPRISCPRKSEPRAKVPKGAVGIGGNQAGIYSLESPGGWQIIGRTPLSFFKPKKDPPVTVELGDKVIFDRISEDKFNEIERG
jgi:inhibitor of KinA